MQHELLAGFVAAVEHVESLGWDAIRAHERALGERFLGGLPANVTLYGPPTMEGRVPTFAFNVAGRSPAEVSALLGERGFAVWHGNYYAVEIMERLGLARRRGARRVRPLQHRRRRSTGCSRSSRRCEAAHPRRDEVPRQARRGGRARRGARGDALHARGDEPGALPRGRAPARRPRRRPRARSRGASGTSSSTHRATCHASSAPRRELLAHAVGRYVFISSISVYASFAEPATEVSPLAVLEDRRRRSTGARPTAG